MVHTHTIQERIAIARSQGDSLKRGK